MMVHVLQIPIPYDETILQANGENRDRLLLEFAEQCRAAVTEMDDEILQGGVSSTNAKTGSDSTGGIINIIVNDDADPVEVIHRVHRHVCENVAHTTMA